MQISIEQIRFAASLAKEVNLKQLEIADAARILVSEAGMNPSSARGYVETFIHMLSGNVYTRTINASAIECYFQIIHEEYDLSALSRAVESVRKHLDYYYAVRGARQVTIRNTLDRYTNILISESNQDQLNSSFIENVQISQKDTSDERKTRISVACKEVESFQITTTVYKRNPDVVSETLYRAQGNCERCKKKAPFVRSKDGTAYLEVHHIKQLAHGGEDSLENTLALCPNCHREMHFG